MDFHELLVVFAQDGQVVPRDRRNVVRLGGGDVGLRLVVTVGHERLKNTTFSTKHLDLSLLVLDPKMYFGLVLVMVTKTVMTAKFNLKRRPFHWIQLLTYVHCFLQFLVITLWQTEVVYATNFLYVAGLLWS